MPYLTITRFAGDPETSQRATAVRRRRCRRSAATTD